MTSAELLIDAFGRVHEDVHAAVAGLSSEELGVRLDPEANSIAWLVWHLARVQDDHLADAFGVSQVWPSWASRFSLPFDVQETGYAHDTGSVAAVRASGQVLTGYHDAVHEMTVSLVSKVTDDDLGRIVDRRWTPPVTLGVRLVSVVNDTTQHAGQAAFIRGVLLRLRG
jgi:uncharacterized damage-inducible protein DinB